MFLSFQWQWRKHFSHLFNKPSIHTNLILRTAFDSTFGATCLHKLKNVLCFFIMWLFPFTLFWIYISIAGLNIVPFWQWLHDVFDRRSKNCFLHGELFFQETWEVIILPIHVYSRACSSVPKATNGNVCPFSHHLFYSLCNCEQSDHLNCKNVQTLMFKKWKNYLSN